MHQHLKFKIEQNNGQEVVPPAINASGTTPVCNLLECNFILILELSRQCSKLMFHCNSESEAFAPFISESQWFALFYNIFPVTRGPMPSLLSFSHELVEHVH